MEEDIKILEERIDYFKCHPEGCNWRLSFEDEKDIKALENLIKGYRELEEENKKAYAKYLNARTCIDKFSTQTILKSKIKEKIEPVIDSLEKDGFVGYADELRDIVSELMEDK